MNSNIGPDILIEIRRYDEPEVIFAFHHLEPTDDTKYWTQPFAGPSDAVPIDPETGLVKDSPIYIERAGFLQSAASRAAKQEELIKAGYKATQMADLPENFRHYVIHCQAPIEWHRSLDAGEKKVMDRIMVWANGEFPS